MSRTASRGSKTNASEPVAKAARRSVNTIARRTLLIDSLETQNSDRLDFHECHVSRIRAALLEAWQQGFREAGRSEAIRNNVNANAHRSIEEAWLRGFFKGFEDGLALGLRTPTPKGKSS